LGGVNLTSTDFICGSSITNCSLDKAIYAYAEMPEDYEPQLKTPSTAQIKPLEDKDLKKEKTAFNVYVKDQLDAQASFDFENSLTAKGRENLDFIVKNKINPLDVITTHEAIQETNDSLRDSNGAPYIFTAASLGKDIAANAYIRRAKVAQEAANAYLNLNNKLPELKERAQKYSGSLKKNFNQVAGHEITQFEKSFNNLKELRILDRDSVYNHGQHRTEVHQNRFNSKNVDIYVGSVEDASKLSKIVGLAKIVGKGSFVYDISVGAYQISQAEDKSRETAKVAGSIGGGMLGAAVGGTAVSVALGSNPVGWGIAAAIGAYAVISGITGYYGSDIGEKVGEWIYEGV